ncbi:hypothetical protein WME75_04600 [Sorangium sp. So ce1014]
MLHIRGETEYNLPAHPREFAMNPEVLQDSLTLAFQRSGDWRA